MTLSPEEIGAFVAGAQGLLVNLGTFDARTARGDGNRGGDRRRKTVCLGCSTPYSSNERRRAPLLRASSSAAEPGGCASQSCGIFRARRRHDDARKRNSVMRGPTRTVVALSGETDLITDGERVATVANGHPLMAKVTAMGCAGSALLSACLAVEPRCIRARPPRRC